MIETSTKADAEPTHIVFYWAGKVPIIAELSILSAVNRTERTLIHLFLDCDRDYESSLPNELSDLVKHPRIVLHSFRLSAWASRTKRHDLPFSDFSTPEPSRNRDENVSGSLKGRILSLRNFLTRKHGHFRLRVSKTALLLIQKYLPFFPTDHQFFGKIFGFHHELFERWGPASLRFALLTSGKSYRADVFRCLAANLYPGESILYADLDVYFVSSPKTWDLSMPFIYRWEENAWGNNALLFFPANRSILRRSLNSKLFGGAPARPWFLFSEENCSRSGIRILPADKFDPMWARSTAHFGDSDAFFEKRPESRVFLAEIREKFKTVHWHNHWNVIPERGSPFAVLLDGERAQRAVDAETARVQFH